MMDDAEKIVDMMPFLNRFALKLTRNKPDADDLVQWTILAALEWVGRGNVFITNPRGWLGKVMYRQFLWRFARKYHNQCEYMEQMKPTLPEQELIGLFGEVERQIQRHRPHNQEMLRKFIQGEDWPKLRQATKDFKTEISIYIGAK